MFYYHSLYSFFVIFLILLDYTAIVLWSYCCQVSTAPFDFKFVLLEIEIEEAGNFLSNKSSRVYSFPFFSTWLLVIFQDGKTALDLSLCYGKDFKSYELAKLLKTVPADSCLWRERCNWPESELNFSWISCCWLASKSSLCHSASEDLQQLIFFFKMRKLLMEQFIIFHVIDYLEFCCGKVRIDNIVLSKPHSFSAYKLRILLVILRHKVLGELLSYFLWTARTTVILLRVVVSTGCSNFVIDCKK